MSGGTAGSATAGVRRPVRLHVVGRRNAGKTTLVCDLVTELTGRCLRVATIKHTHHDHEFDTAGKDSHRHRESGAAGVGILSPRLHALFIPVVPNDTQTDQEGRYQLFASAFSDCDLILVEGDLHTCEVRVEVWRAGLADLPYACEDPRIAAVITDDGCPGIRCRKIPRSSIRQIADEVVRLCGLSTDVAGT